MPHNELIAPHGNSLITKTIKTLVNTNISIEINSHNLADIECIATGIYSPLDGFLDKKNYHSVVNSSRLTNGLVWPVPVTFAVSNADNISLGDIVTLTWENNAIAQLQVEDIYQPDKQLEAEHVYGTTDSNHPGVKRLMQSGDIYLGGSISMLTDNFHSDFMKYRLTPSQTRAYFQQQGWQTIAAFQTRNPIHRAHEYLQKTALEMTDGLFINPLVGATKQDDVPADIRMQSYEIILDKYYPSNNVLLGVFPAAMRYAGPREAIMHAIARKNYGCSHFIVGRDHAGVGDYYGTYDAQKIFDKFTADEIGITILKFEHAFNCKACGQMATTKTCPHDKSQHTHLSGTKVRSMLSNGELPPKEFTRPEVAKILINAYQGAKNGV